MAICPECRAGYGDDVQTCPEHGCALVPDDLFVPAADEGLAEGTMVGEYRIQRKLGAGTFGDVYAGEHPLIGKRVAIKVLNQRFATDPVMVSRFVAEARAVNKIRQRNIIDIFSFGVLPGLDRHYFVMELLDGLTLGELMDRSGRLALSVVIPIVREIAEALDAVHEAGITHRDLKPDNVFLATERDGSYFPKLLDFGIAKLIGDEAAHRTGPGMVMGTPRYMSPEQARGKPADHRADIYALGVMIHEMLTGRPLFVGESAIDVLLMHATDPPPRMSSVCPDLPAELDAPVLAMLEKDLKKRPSSAGNAVAALVACAAKLPASRAPAGVAKAARNGGELDPRGPSHHGTTVTVAGVGAEPADARESPLESASTLPADSSAEGSARVGRSAQSTEGLSAIETSSAMRRLGRSRRWKAVAGAVAAVLVGFTIWSFGRAPHPDGGRPVAALGSTIEPAVPAPSAPSSAAPAEPLVKPDVVAPQLVEVRLATRPAEVEVWLGDRKLGTSAAPLTLPRGSESVLLRLKKAGFRDESLSLVPDRSQSREVALAPLPGRPEPAPTAKPTSSAGRIDKLLEGRD
ncbi:MAG: serine/threonine-protein kinase [Byssovorax sp.]